MKMNRIMALGAAIAMLSIGAAQAQTPAPHDGLEANLWTQRSVEFKGNALTVFALARIRLDQALADKTWTAAPVEQKGDFANLPPAVVLDIDETALDNSLYQVWSMKAGTAFSLPTWNEFCNAKVSRAVPGAAEFTKYAESKGVKVFYISNRAAETPGFCLSKSRNTFGSGFPSGAISMAGIEPTPATVWLLNCSASPFFPNTSTMSGACTPIHRHRYCTSTLVGLR